MISRLIGFYATQVRVLWEWRGGRLALLRSASSSRSLVATVSFVATDWIMGSRFEVDRVVDAVVRGHPDGAVQRHRSGRSCWRSPRRSR